MTVAEFAGEASSVRAARRFISAELVDVADGPADDIRLMASELAANCVRHANSTFTVTATRSGATIRVEVTDTGGGVPTMRTPGPTEASGRGLKIIDTLAESWGIDPHPGGGKTVWFVASLTSSAADDRARAR